MDVPGFSGQLCSVSPVSVKPAEAYENLRSQLVEFSTGLERVIADSEPSYAFLSGKLSELRNLKKELAAHQQEIAKDLATADSQIISLFSQLYTPLNEAIAYLSSETRNYQEEKERVRLEFEEQLRLKAQAEADAKKRTEDLQTLRKQLYGARQIADNSEVSGQPETAKEIRLAIQKYANLDVNPNIYPKPLKDAEEIRAIIAKAFQNEQDRLKK